MNDRKSFTITLLLVVVAGIAMGLIAFSLGRRDGADRATPVADTSVSGTANHKAPSPSDPQPELLPSGGAARTSGQASELAPAGEPALPRKDAPQMQGAGNGDPPGTSQGSDQAQPPTALPLAKEQSLR